MSLALETRGLKKSFGGSMVWSGESAKILADEQTLDARLGVAGPRH